MIEARASAVRAAITHSLRQNEDHISNTRWLVPRSPAPRVPKCPMVPAIGDTPAARPSAWSPGHQPSGRHAFRRHTMDSGTLCLVSPQHRQPKCPRPNHPTSPIRLYPASVPTPVPRIIYHYTTTEGLLGIIERSVLYATDVLYMNDSQEVEYPNSVLKKVVESIVVDESMYTKPSQRECVAELGGFLQILIRLHEEMPTYAVCFCASGDLLSQWRAYSAHGGFAIGFDRNALELWPRGRLAAVDYDWIAQSARLAGIVKRTMESDALVEGSESAKRLAQECATDLWFNALFFKSAAFEAEQEWRLVDGVDLRSRIEELRFRDSRIGITPFIEQEFPAGAESPIREIVVGPTAHSAQVERAVRLLLAKVGLRRVEVRRSAVSLRP